MISQAPAPTIDYFTRPAFITALAVLNFITAATFVIVICIAVPLALLRAGGATLRDAGLFRVLGGVVLSVSLSGGLGAFSFMTGLGLWTLKPYGRTLEKIKAGGWLLLFPLGTIVAWRILNYLNSPALVALFSGHAASDLNAEEALAVQALSRRLSGGMIAFVAMLTILVILVDGSIVFGTIR
jgi:hypothetical protein